MTRRAGREESEYIDRDGVAACDTADFTDGDRRLRSFAVFAHLERPRIWMREPVAIEYRVFIRIVQRARTHELGNERRLAGEAVAGQHDSVAAETDDARLNEGVLCGTFGDPHDEEGTEKIGNGIEWRGAYEPSAVEAKGVKIFCGMLPKRVFRNAGRVRRLSRTTGKPRPNTIEHEEISLAQILIRTPCAVSESRCADMAPFVALPHAVF